jgi:hypothetical protein
MQLRKFCRGLSCLSLLSKVQRCNTNEHISILDVVHNAIIVPWTNETFLLSAKLHGADVVMEAVPYRSSELVGTVAEHVANVSSPGCSTLIVRRK